MDGLVQERHNSSALAMELFFLALTHRYILLYILRQSVIYLMACRLCIALFHLVTFTYGSRFIHIILDYLTHWGLVTPYGVIDLGQHWLRLWLVAWRHQAITCTNVDLRTLASYSYQYYSYINKYTCKNLHFEIIFPWIFLHLPGANELTGSSAIIQITQYQWKRNEIKMQAN